MFFLTRIWAGQIYFFTFIDFFMLVVFIGFFIFIVFIGFLVFELQLYGLEKKNCFTRLPYEWKMKKNCFTRHLRDQKRRRIALPGFSKIGSKKDFPLGGHREHHLGRQKEYPLGAQREYPLGSPKSWGFKCFL